MTLDDLCILMCNYNSNVTNDSECEAWQDFVYWSYHTYDISPFDDRASCTTIEDNEYEYWHNVAKGPVPHYIPEPGDRSE